MFKLKDKKIFKVIYNIVFGLLVVLIILLVFSIFPVPGNFKLMTVVSGSMEPEIGVGSVVVVKPVREYMVGDVITFGEFLNGKTPTTHRITDMVLLEGKEGYITKGDANDSVDQKKVLKRDVLGKVILKISFIGYVIDAVKKPIGFLLVIILPAIYIVFDELRKVYKEIRKLRKGKVEKDLRQDEIIEKLEDEIEQLKGKVSKKKKK